MKSLAIVALLLANTALSGCASFAALEAQPRASHSPFDNNKSAPDPWRFRVFSLLPVEG